MTTLSVGLAFALLGAMVRLADPCWLGAVRPVTLLQTPNPRSVATLPTAQSVEIAA